MDKLAPKREVGIIVASETASLIIGQASPNAISDLESLGTIYPESCGKFYLFVDSRFDFQEVEQYVRNYDQIAA